jgi:2,4-dienoyl-CoA reductase-like NADH-dependent reductase (Old Yellow Enzyme family)
LSKLFEVTTINTMTLKNRFVRSATWMGMATEDNSVSQRLINEMVKLAEGGVGLIISGYATVRADGQSVPWQLGNYSDEHLPGLTEMAAAVHKASGTIVNQIAYGGVFAIPQITGVEPMGPSVIQGPKGPICREMTKKDIRETINAFGQAAARAKKAGFDGVQLHAAHGFGLNQWLSPFFNKRTDEYGGSIENRARIVLETYESIRDAVGEQFPVLAKLNAADFLEEGFSTDDMLKVAKMLEKAGIDAIELSGGTIKALLEGNSNESFSRTRQDEVYYLEEAKRYKEKIDVPLMLVGGIRSYEVAEQLVEEGIADYIALCRPLIREPDLINRWKAGDTRKAECNSDNACFEPGNEGKGVTCVHVSK